MIEICVDGKIASRKIDAVLAGETGLAYHPALFDIPDPEVFFLFI